MSIDELVSIEETLAVLISADMIGDIDAARVELDANAATPMSKAQAIAAVRDSRGTRAVAFPGTPPGGCLLRGFESIDTGRSWSCFDGGRGA